MEPLKNMYNPAFLSKVADIAATAIPNFDRDLFIREVFANEWPMLELKQRVRRISTVLHSMFSGNYKKDIKTLLLLTEALHRHAGRDNTFEYIFLADYIEQYGLEHPVDSLKAMERITILCSCEYAIRPFIINDMESTLKAMLLWAKHPHASVRRLASEGCRPRLPWAIALPQLKKDPAPILPILEILKNDSSEYVRKSVANNINDIAKDNPLLALQIAKKWKGTNRNTDWIIKHGCRTLLKKGDKEALQIFGLSHQAACSVTSLKLQQKKINIGQHLHFSFHLVNDADVATSLRVEYAITYAKANNKQSRKVFKVTENTYAPAVAVPFIRKQSFADMTTRKHYAGVHTIEILINGVSKASANFEVM